MSIRTRSWLQHKNGLGPDDVDNAAARGWYSQSIFLLEAVPGVFLAVHLDMESDSSKNKPGRRQWQTILINIFVKRFVAPKAMAGLSRWQVLEHTFGVHCGVRSVTGRAVAFE